MCGICGIIRFDGQEVREAPVKRMMELMRHRGPDDQGSFIDDNVGLGFVRLSIIDLSDSGHQPMYSEDGRYIMIFNGEIYNYIELRQELISEGIRFNTRSDSEVLLKAFIHFGPACLEKLNGMWSFVIFDSLEKKIFASRDRFGVKPFYFIRTDDFFAFSSEIPPLLSLQDKKPEPDYQTIFDFLVFNRTDHTGSTFFKEIKKMQHGSYLTLDTRLNGQNDLNISRWYDLKERVAITTPFSDDKEYRDLFSSAVNLRLRSDVPVGVCLSGGLDSSAIVSVLLSDYGKKDLKTFSAIYKKGQMGDESEFISEFTPLLKNMYYITPDGESLLNDLESLIRMHAEPFPTTSPYAQYKVMQLAEGKVVVTLDGQGADEALGGYHYFFGFYFKDLLKRKTFLKLVSEIAHYLIRHRSLYGLKTFFFFLLSESRRRDLRISELGYLNRNFLEKYRETSSVSGNIYDSGSFREALFNHFEYKLEHLLKWEDRNSMAFSLEARVPFLDYRLVEKTLASSDFLIKKGRTKSILRTALSDILPAGIAGRDDKIGFETPENEWFRKKEWQGAILSVLSAKSFSERGIIDQAAAVRTYKDFLAGKKVRSKEIWKWLNLELWFREFID